MLFDRSREDDARPYTTDSLWSSSARNEHGQEIRARTPGRSSNSSSNYSGSSLLSDDRFDDGSKVVDHPFTQPQLPSPIVAVHAPRLPEEIPVIASLHRALLQVQYEDDFYQELADSSGGAPRQRGDPLAPDASCVTVAAYVAGSMVGVVTARATRQPGFTGWVKDLLFARQTREGYIMTLCVLPHQQGRGIGKRLVRAACGELHQRLRCASVSLHCLESNRHARALYASCGFAEVQRLPDHYFFDGVPHAALFLTRPLPLDASAAGSGGTTAAGGPAVDRRFDYHCQQQVQKQRDGHPSPNAAACAAHDASSYGLPNCGPQLAFGYQSHQTGAFGPVAGGEAPFAAQGFAPVLTTPACGDPTCRDCGVAEDLQQQSRMQGELNFSPGGRSFESSSCCVEPSCSEPHSPGRPVKQQLHGGCCHRRCGGGSRAASDKRQRSASDSERSRCSQLLTSMLPSSWRRFLRRIASAVRRSLWG